MSLDTIIALSVIIVVVWLIFDCRRWVARNRTHWS